MEPYLKPGFSVSKPLLFKTFRSNKDRTHDRPPLNVSALTTTTNKTRILLETPLSPDKHSRSLQNRLEKAQKRIEHIENDQKSVKRLLNSLRGDSEDSMCEASSVYLIEKVKTIDRNPLEEGFFASIPLEIEGDAQRNELFRELLVKMAMFRKTYSLKSNLERVLEFIRRRIDRNSGVYYDFLSENNPVFLKVLLQIMYDTIEGFFIQNKGSQNQNDSLRQGLEEKIAALNRDLLEKLGLLESLQRDKNLLTKTLGYHQKVIEELVTMLDDKGDGAMALIKLRLLLKDFRTIEENHNINFKELEAGKTELQEPEFKEKDALRRKIEGLEGEMKSYRDLLVEKERRETEIKELRRVIQDLQRGNEAKEGECRGLQKRLEDTRKEISGLSKDLLKNSREKEDLLKRITEENEDLLRRNEELVRKNEGLGKENKTLERKFEDQLVVFKADLQKAWKSVLELTEKKNLLEKEKEGFVRKLNEETETKERILREARMQEKKGLAEKLEWSERALQEALGEKALLIERLQISEAKNRDYGDKLENHERALQLEKEKLAKRTESALVEYKKELKEMLTLEGNSLKDLRLLTRLLGQTLELLSRANGLPPSLSGVREELLQKREEAWQRFGRHNDEFAALIGLFNQKYDLGVEPEDLVEVSVGMGFDKRDRSFSEVSMRSGKNYESNKRDRIIEENVDLMIYLQACSLENMLEQLQNKTEEIQSKGSEEEKNLSYNADLEKINEMSEDEAHTQNSNP